MRPRLSAADLADKYAARDGSAPAPASVEPAPSSYIVGDVAYPDMRAVLTSLRAKNGQDVHVRQLVGIVAAALGVLMDEWDGETWAQTIRDEWLLDGPLLRSRKRGRVPTKQWWLRS